MTRSSLLAFLALMALSKGVAAGSGRWTRRGLLQSGPPMCSSAPLDESADPVKTSVFNELSTEEIFTTIAWMLEEFPDLQFHGEIPGDAGVSIVKNATTVTPQDNYIYKVLLENPSKAEVLAYLDGDGDVPLRYARAIVVRGANMPRDVQEFKVGPLPIGPETTAVPLHPDGFIPYVKKAEDGPEYGWMDEPLGNATDILKEVFFSMTGSDKCYGPAEECGYDYFTWWSQASLLEDGTTRISNVQWWFKPLGTQTGNEFNMFPLPLYFKLNHTAEFIEDWFTFDFVYCNQGPFETAEEFLEAFTSGDLKICATNIGAEEYDNTWSRTDVPRGPRVNTSAEMAGPKTVWPEGQRFTLGDTASETGRSFSWMGWEGHVTVDPYSGFQFFDLKFLRKRIIYELALEELYANYAGFGIPGQVYYYDSLYGIGSEVYPLRPGVDCPEGAAYMGVSYLDYTGVIAHVPQAVCFFEDDLGTSDWRHTHHGAEEPHADSVRSTEFVVRMVTTPGNYDYVQSYRFKLDGSIEVDIKMGGYMSTSFYDPNGATFQDKPYMPRVAEYVAGVLHDHLGLWKVDLDVLGTKNKFVKKSLKYGTYEDAGNAAPGWGVPYKFKYMAEELVEKETGYRFSYDVPAVYQVQAMDAKNTWGVPRAYAVAVGYTTSQLLDAEHPIAKAQYWTTNHITTTLRKDAEERGHYSLFDYHSSSKPLFSMKDYLNDEAIVGEDLVLWVTMGAQHVPRSEDVPLITNHGTSMLIKPWNYFDSLVTMDIVDKFSYEACTPDLGDPEANEWTMAGTPLLASMA